MSKSAHDNYPDEQNRCQCTAKRGKDESGLPGQGQADDRHTPQKQHSDQDSNADQLHRCERRLPLNTLEPGGGKEFILVALHLAHRVTEVQERLSAVSGFHA